MIRRFYVHNFRCLENFELKLEGRASTLLIGNNGSGKSSVAAALEILQSIGRGTNVVTDLISLADFSLGRHEVPMRFEIEAEVDGRIIQYTVAFEIQRGSGELGVRDEQILVDGILRFTRDNAAPPGGPLPFQISSQVVALPILDQGKKGDPFSLLRHWLAVLLILRPAPSLILGDTPRDSLWVRPDVSNFDAWFSSIFTAFPSAYSSMERHLKEVMPDFKDIRKQKDGGDRGLSVQFTLNGKNVLVPFRNLSDGEKCFFICAQVLAMNEAMGPIFCFWDEPDNYLALSEVGHFVMALRRSFESGGQLVTTSHNSEAIRAFSNENTLVLYRRNHFEPTQVRPLSEIQVNGDLVNALIRGDVEP